MPGFSRKDPSSAAKPSQAKLLLVGALGLALVGVAAANWHSFRPRSAEASAPTADIADGNPDNRLVPSQTTPEQMIANLAADPTARFLRGQDNSLGQLEAAPPDPFRLAPSWIKNLVKPKLVEYVLTTAPTPTRTPPAFVFNADSIKIQVVFKDRTRNSALINGVPMNVGGVVAGCQITKITDELVQFQPLGQPANAAFTLPVNSRFR